MEEESPILQAVMEKVILLNFVAFFVVAIIQWTEDSKGHTEVSVVVLAVARLV